MFVNRLYKRIAKYYDRFARHYGGDYRALNWVSPESQQKRFTAIANLLEPGVSINDVGCGHGDLFHFLTNDDRDFLSFYVGYDLSGKILENVPISIREHPRAAFHCISNPHEILQADYSIASGIFNNNFLTTLKRQHYSLFEEVILAMWEKSNTGIIFNLMVRQRKESYDGLFYFDQAYIEDFLSSAISPQFQITDDYDSVDRTFFVQKV